MDDVTRKRLADALLSGLDAAGGAAKGVIGSMFSPQANMARAERFMTGYDPETGEDLTERSLWPNAENGGRLGEVAAFIQGNGMRAPMGAERAAGVTLGSGPVVDAKAIGRALRRELPMDEASRMARAAEQGFEVSQPLYHGTTADIARFKPSKSGVTGPGIYLGDAPEVAATYAYGDGANIMPVLARGPWASMERWSDAVDAHGWDEARRALKKEGFTGVHDDRFESAVNVWDPKDIRSTQAAFDPAMSGSSNLLASGGPAPLPTAPPKAGNVGTMDVNAAYEATKSEDPATRRRAMIIYALRGGA